jgi:hypothetical protein
MCDVLAQAARVGRVRGVVPAERGVEAPGRARRHRLALAAAPRQGHLLAGTVQISLLAWKVFFESRVAIQLAFPLTL